MPAPKFISSFIIKAVFILGFVNILVSSFNTTAQILNNEQDAFRQAQALNRPVFLVFSGSDWCVPCIRFQKEILSDSSFINYADENLVILVAEFPQKKTLPPDIIRQNEKLAEKVKQMLLEKGIQSGVVNASGDIAA